MVTTCRELERQAWTDLQQITASVEEKIYGRLK
jgi:hypothetical protein